jgi:nucleoside-diphosphate-sugar epimerase
MISTKRYAISGMGGFIGSALAKRLIDSGCCVIPIDRSVLYNEPLLTSFFYKTKPDCIVHLAAYGNHYDHKSIPSTVKANIIGTTNVLIASQGIPVYNFSSSSVLLENKTPYSITKECGEQITSLFPNAKSIRPYSVYGPGEADFRFIPTVIRALHTGKNITLDEHATHDWIYIEDFITAFLNGQTEIGTGLQYRNLEIVKILQQISGKRLNYKPGKLRTYDTDSWVCKSGVPHRSIEDGLLQTYLHYTK